MMIQQHHERFLQLRKDYPEFIYEKFTIDEDAHKLYFKFFYTISPHLRFIHEIDILKKHFPFKICLSHPLIAALAHHLGLIELIRYWKCTCSPTVILEAGSLSPAQIIWWKKLYYKGLGEFFYVNGIETTREDFMDVHSSSSPEGRAFHLPVDEINLIPLGGGKDSIVTLQLLSKMQAENTCLVVRVIITQSRTCASC